MKLKELIEKNFHEDVKIEYLGGKTSLDTEIICSWRLDHTMSPLFNMLCFGYILPRQNFHSKRKLRVGVFHNLFREESYDVKMI